MPSTYALDIKEMIRFEESRKIPMIKPKIVAKLFREHENCKNDEGLEDKNRKSIEIEADKFAAYLLMPSIIIKNAFFKKVWD